MTTREAFRANLAEGQEGEARMAAAFYAAGWAFKRVNGGPYLDLEVRGNGRTWAVEVKNEDKNAHTGNIALELYQGTGEHRRRSCLSITEAHICIHKLGPRVAAYRSQAMRIFLHDEAARYKVRPVGDNNNDGILMPIADVIDKPWFVHCHIEDLPKASVFKD